MSNDSLSPSLAPIPFEVIGKPGRRASVDDRDRAASELLGYAIIMLRFGLAIDWQEQLLKRINKVQRAHGNGESALVFDAAEHIRAAADPVPTKAAFEATEARLALLMQEPAE